MLMGNGKKPSRGVKHEVNFFNRTGPIKILNKPHGYQVEEVLNVTDINDDDSMPQRRGQPKDSHFLYGHMRNQGPFENPVKQRKSNSQKPQSNHLIEMQQPSRNNSVGQQVRKHNSDNLRPGTAP